ncbi:MAG: hypothetical protein ACF8PN_10760 [Phycisphaerales bacterium]
MGWTLIALGFAGGALLGLRFDVPGWLGGYDALPRRLVRLAHIALVALGALNLLAAPSLGSNPDHRLAAFASWCWIAGAVTMPLACYLMAWRPSFKPVFVIPVVLLILAALCTAVIVFALPR